MFDGKRNVTNLVINVSPKRETSTWIEMMMTMIFQVKVGNGLGIHTAAALTCMDGAIGRHVGNSLEVIESLETLKGEGPADLMELVTTLGNHVCYGP